MHFIVSYFSTGDCFPLNMMSQFYPLPATEFIMKDMAQKGKIFMIYLVLVISGIQ